MSKTSCCELKYLGENHNPIHTATYCRNCNYIHEFIDVKQLKQQNKIMKEALEYIYNTPASNFGEMLAACHIKAEEALKRIGCNKGNTEN